MAGFDELALMGIMGAVEEAEVDANHQRRVYESHDPSTELNNKNFVKLYRLIKETTTDLIQLLEPHIQAPTRVSALSIERKVLTALRFFASGSYQTDVGYQINHAVSQSTVSRCIEEVSNALNVPEIFNSYVKLPPDIQELIRIRNGFYEKYNFPGVIGCVDCTHTAIYPPQINDAIYPEAAYVNRKGYHSINTQLICDFNLRICDFNLRILNVSARYPGSTNDSFIWNNSNALNYMKTLHRNGHSSFYLLGDSGYSLRPWLLAPIADAAPNSPEERYNERHMSTRSLIERCNGVLKLKFRCLLKHRVLHYKPVKCSKIINACTVLHNICIENNIPLENDNIEYDFGIYDGVEDLENHRENRLNPELAAGRRVQQLVIRNHFA